MRGIVLMFTLCMGTALFSQNCNYSLSGTVIDLHDNTVLAGATLIIAETDRAVQTDLDGKYLFENLCEDTYFIQVSHPFCRTQGYTLKITKNTDRDFKLEHHLEELNQITLRGNAYSTKSKTLFQNQISNQQLDAFSNVSLGDALKTISGVSTLNTGNTVAKPIINGLHSSRIIIINNGVRMEDQEWGAEHAPNIDINTAGRITLLKGAGALQYGGDAIGGVIVAEAPKTPITDSIYGKTIVTGSTNGRGGTLMSQLTKTFESGWFASLQGTLKRFGDFESPDYVLSNTGAFERNLSARLGYNGIDKGLEAYYSLFKNEVGILRASHLGGAEDQVIAINSPRPLIVEDFTYDISSPKQDVTHHLFRLKGFYRFKNVGKVSLQYDFQRNNRLEFDIRRGDDEDQASLDLELNTHSVMADLESKLGSRTELKAGVMGSFQENFPDPGTGVRRLIPDYDKYDFGAYSILNHNISTDLLFEAGARVDYTHMDVFKFYRTSLWESRGYDERFADLVIEELDNQLLTNPLLDFINLSATVGVSYRFSDASTLFANYSLASRAPNPSELFSEGLHHSASRIELGELAFSSEVGHKFAFTLQHETQTFDFAVQPFYQLIDKFKTIEPTGIQQTIRGNFQVWEYRETQAQLLGLDVDASYGFTDHLRSYHQFSLVKGYDIDEDRPLINMPPASFNNALRYENAELNNLKIGIESSYIFEQNEFPDTNFEVFLPATETTETVDLSTPPDGYHLLNADASVDFEFSKSVLTVGLGATNILNNQYRNYLNRLRYYADDLGSNYTLTIKYNY